MKSNHKIQNLNRILKNTIVVTLMILSSCNINPEESEKSRKIDDLVNYCYEKELFNGTVLVASSDEIIYQNAFGFTDYDCSTPLKLNSVFGLASVTKTITSVAVMMLKEEMFNLKKQLNVY